MTSDNSWMANSAALVQAYARHNDGLLGTVRQRLLARALAAHMPPGPQRVIDIGGGEGYQAMSLAGAGHHVVLLDPDPEMLDGARARLAEAEPEVAERVELVLGYGEQAVELTGGGFDVVCCHGILMYVNDPEPLLRNVVGLARPGGLISVLAKNADAAAMRPALEGRWADALVALQAGIDLGGHNVTSRSDTVEGIEALLAAAGATSEVWYGLRIFSDHYGDAPAGPGIDELCELEWLAGTRDPYRRVARLIHVLARQTDGWKA